VRVPPNTSDPSTSTTQLYDRREDRITLDEVVKINIRGYAGPRHKDQIADQIAAAQKSAAVFGTGTLLTGIFGELVVFLALDVDRILDCQAIYADP
jgi:hypothetical protein